MYVLIFVTMFGGSLTEKEVETFDTYEECSKARILYTEGSFMNEIFVCDKVEGQKRQHT